MCLFVYLFICLCVYVFILVYRQIGIGWGNGLTDFDQYTVCGFGMKEADPFVVRTGGRFILQKLETIISQSLHF